MHPAATNPIRRTIKHFPCTEPGCNRTFVTPNGRTSHITTVHRRPRVPVVYDSPNDALATPPRRHSVPASPPNSARSTHSPYRGAEHIDQHIFNTGYDEDLFGAPFLSRVASPIAEAFSPSGAGAAGPNDDTLRRSPEPANSEGPASVNAGPTIDLHPHLTGEPCKEDGSPLPPDAPPPPLHHPSIDNYQPFRSAAEFQLADFLFRRVQMSGSNIDNLMQILSRLQQAEPPFADHEDLYACIDAIQQGDVPWKSFRISYSGEVPTDRPTPTWMSQEFEVWARDPEVVLSNQIKNPDFSKEMDYAPKRVFGAGDKREYKDFMSGNWCWRQSDDIYKADPSTQGATFCPIITGSDKTTVSVGTGHTEYHPLYVSNGLIHNNVRRAHRNGVSLLAFMCIPKTDKEYDDDDDYRDFRRQLFHSTLHEIFYSMHEAMEKPVVKLCADGHYRRIIFGLGPHIADYPEQVLLACIVYMWCPKCTVNRSEYEDLSDALPRSNKLRDFLLENMEPDILWNEHGIISNVVPFTNGLPRADISENISMDILHQLVKGTFKDHLVEWTVKYINSTYPKAAAEQIISDIDRRIAVTPHFAGLRRFNQGRGFKQWTGDDSKALMKVFLPAIVGHVPDGIVKTIASFLEFCYLVRRSVIDEDMLKRIEDSLADFLEHRKVFLNLGIRNNFNLPRQHSMTHWPSSIREFAAPGGLDSAITESKHIQAVKEPWRRSNRFNAIGQMLLTNQRLDKLAAARVDFVSRGMLDVDPFVGILPPGLTPAVPHPNVQVPAPAEDGETPGATDTPYSLGQVKLAKTRKRKVPRDLVGLGELVGQPRLEEAARCFLWSKLNPNSDINIEAVPMENLPTITGKVNVFSSAVATFHAPSDQSGLHGMIRERIRCSQDWRGSGYPRRDCMFVNPDPEVPGFLGLDVARVLLFFSFQHEGKTYPCCLVEWFQALEEAPCKLTGMWRVEPDIEDDGERAFGVISVEAILRCAHLLPVFGDRFIPREVNMNNSLDVFSRFYVNKYADHHSHEIAF